jgi:two-component system cell cycle sensor histidine kinase/response regulator CckA
MDLGGARKTILVMDDELMVRDIACQMLDFLGYNTIPAYDGHEAINLYQEYQTRGENIDAVLMDLSIPGGMGGREAIGELLAVDRNAKVFVCSGYSTDPIVQDYRTYGFIGVISKPFDIASIKALLEQHLS